MEYRSGYDSCFYFFFDEETSSGKRARRLDAASGSFIRDEKERFLTTTCHELKIVIYYIVLSLLHREPQERERERRKMSIPISRILSCLYESSEVVIIILLRVEVSSVIVYGAVYPRHSISL